MRLALKFTLAFLVGMCVVLAVYAYQILQREIAFFQYDEKRDERALGYAFAVAVRNVWEAFGEEAALDLIDRANRSEAQNRVTVRWVWPDAPASSPYHPRIQGEALASLRGGKEITWTNRAEGSTGRLYTCVPVSIRGTQTGAVEVSDSLDEQHAYTRATIWRLLMATGTVAVLSALLALALGFRLVGRPVQALIANARRVATGDFTGRLHFRQHDELRELAEASNVMCDQLAAAQERLAAETAARIATIEQLRHADRLKTVGQLASGVAHELGTPLNVVWARAKMIAAADPPGTNTISNARIIAEQAERMTKIIRQMLDFAHSRTPKRTRADLRVIARQTLSLLACAAEQYGVTMELLGSEQSVYAEIDPCQITQVLSNLVINGSQAMPSGGRLTIAIRRERVQPPADLGKPEDEYFRVSVQDEGDGIPEAHLPHVFEPFFTTKDVGKGTGLGLSVSQGIVREHGGWISVVSQVGQGTCFTVYLPTGPDQSAPVAMAPADP